jgi:AraC-like DNA-binding protein
MLHISIRPPAPLARYVASLWYWEGPTQRHCLERIMPSGIASLIINLQEDEVRDYPAGGQVQRHSGSILVGAHSACSIIDTLQQRVVMGVAFRAGGTWPIFGVAGDELSNRHIGLRDLWSLGGSLRDRILCAPTPHARLQILAESLTAQVGARATQHPAVAFALQHLHSAPQLATIEDLGRAAGISTRRLARLFSIEVGLTPKLYARVLRFNRVVESIYNKPEVNWQDIAYQCGYFDQAHFIRDFKAFSGLTPSEYLPRRTAAAHHVLL